jgi:hypothetical protein
MQCGSCKHSWAYNHTVYTGDYIRRWCTKCKLQQHGKVNRWYNSNIGPDKLWDENVYDDFYDDDGIE